MALEILTIPCLSDNYAFLILSPWGGEAALVDAPEAAPILAALDARGLTLTDLLITHHHADHIGAVGTLATGRTRVIGAAEDAHRLPPLDLAVSSGDHFEIFGENVDVMDASGHTMGHIAYHIPSAQAVFTGDSLMALGCGRLFEGQPETMWATLENLAALPAETRVYSGHEYTAANGRFAISVDPDNKSLQMRLGTVAEARANGRATVPSLLGEEIETNPFLRARHPELKAALGMSDATDMDTFAALRHKKDVF